ncbi:MAG: nucleotidyltransferase domain-containing protein [Elusimicrobiota bacterium]
MDIPTLTEKEKQAIDELITELKNLYKDNLSRIILYGSKARGDATGGSDIDIMVVLKKIENKIVEFEKIIKMTTEIDFQYELLTSIILKDEQEYLTRNSPLLLNVRREGVEL